MQGAQLSLFPQGQRHGQACAKEVIAGGWLHYKAKSPWPSCVSCTADRQPRTHTAKCTQAAERQLHVRAQGHVLRQDPRLQRSQGVAMAHTTTGTGLYEGPLPRAAAGAPCALASTAGGGQATHQTCRAGRAAAAAQPGCRRSLRCWPRRWPGRGWRGGRSRPRTAS